MPSLREKLGLKRNKTPKKAKSTGDLENAGSESNLQMSKDYSSQMSSLGRSDAAEGSREETASVVSSTATPDSHVAKKKRFSFKKLRRSLTKKSSSTSSDGEKRTSLIENSNGTLVLVQEYVTNEDLSSEADKNSSDAGVRRTQSCNVHPTSTVEPVFHPCKESSKTENTEDSNSTVDEWRMSGLLDTVERSNSMHSGSSKTNLAQPTDKSILKGGQDESITKPLDTSTPKTDKTSVPTIRFDLVAGTPEALEEGSPSQNAVNDPTKVEPEESKKLKEAVINEQNVPANAQDCCDPKGRKEDAQTRDAEEDKFVETHNLDYEYSSQDTKGDDHEAVRILQNAEGKGLQSEDAGVHSKQPSSGIIEVQLNVKFQNGPIDGANKKSRKDGDQARICALEEAIKSEGMKINQDILANEVLVLNLAKDDWVIVDYNEANGEIIEIFDRSMEVKK